MTDKKGLNPNRLNGKDLINAGIFSAIYVVIIIAVACTLGLIPIGFLLLTFVVPFVEGIPMMLYFTKIKKFGMLIILQAVIGIAMILTGMGYDLLIWAIITGIVGELILKASKYQKSMGCVLAYAVSSICIAGNYVHWLTASQGWLKNKAASYGETFMYSVYGWFHSNWWLFPLLIVSCFVGGFLGGMIGRKVLRKHFERSGLV